jgi:hypothetical protein
MGILREMGGNARDLLAPGSVREILSPGRGSLAIVGTVNMFQHIRINACANNVHEPYDCLARPECQVTLSRNRNSR